MRRILHLPIVLMALISLMMLSFSVSADVPNIQWNAPDPSAEWYQVNIKDMGGVTQLDEWLQDTGSLCSEGACTFDPNTLLPFGLDTSDYDVIVNYWDATQQQITQVTSQQITVTTAETSVSVEGGRVRVTLPNDPEFTWVQLYIGNATDYAQILDLNRPEAPGWYEKATDMDCGGASCTFLSGVHPGNGAYIVYLRYWNESDGISDWYGEWSFALDLNAPAAVTGLNGTVDDERTPTLNWNGPAQATWYRIWLGQQTANIDTWVPAIDLNCAAGGTCAFNPSLQLTGGQVYAWYVYAWGPGGFSTGGLGGSGWAQGPDITVPGSGNAFLMQNGLTVIEVESTPLAGDWSLQNGFAGATGNGYLEWRNGNSGMGITGAGNGILAYTIQIPAAGQYRFLLRGTSPTPSNEYNDLWARIQGDDSRAVAIDPSPDDPDDNDYTILNNDWFKSYNNSVENWRWQASHVDNDAHEIFFEFTAPGEYTVEFSGRSNQFRADRFVIYDPNLVSENDATDINNPESPRG